MVGGEQDVRAGATSLLRALHRLIGAAVEQFQLTLELEPPPRTVHDLRRLLLREGLDDHYSLRLTNNRSVVVSFTSGELRVHHGYLEAPEDVLRAIVRFVRADSRRARAAAKRDLLVYRLPQSSDAQPRKRRPPERTHPADERLAKELARYHDEFNSTRFNGELRRIPIRVSRRMRSRLGHYTWRAPDGNGAEIVISRRHIRRHGRDEALHTLLHEMVHQWQDERGMKVDHGREFRAKARAVGIAPKARRDVA